MADIIFVKRKVAAVLIHRRKLISYRRNQLPYGMIIVSSFKLKYNKESDIFTVVSLLTNCCPLCSGSVYHRDNKTRYLKNANGDRCRFSLRRMLCELCKTLHTEIPEIIQPYKHYDSETIQSVLDGNKEAKACVADDSTIRRWKKSFAEAEPDITRRATSVLKQESKKAVPVKITILTILYFKGMYENWLASIMRLLINNGHKLCTRFAFLRPHPSDKINLRFNTKPKEAKNAEAIKDNQQS